VFIATIIGILVVWLVYELSKELDESLGIRWDKDK